MLILFNFFLWKIRRKIVLVLYNYSSNTPCACLQVKLRNIAKEKLEFVLRTFLLEKLYIFLEIFTFTLQVHFQSFSLLSFIRLCVLPRLEYPLYTEEICILRTSPLTQRTS